MPLIILSPEVAPGVFRAEPGSPPPKNPQAAVIEFTQDVTAPAKGVTAKNPEVGGILIFAGVGVKNPAVET